MTNINRSMSSYEARRATFFAEAEESSKSRKKAVPVWPHPINLSEDALEDDNNGSGSSSTSLILKEKRTKRYPTPSELANLGLYFDSNASDEQDACVLFPENVVFSGWKLGDDVAKKIRKIVPNATLLTIQESKDAAQQDDPKKNTWSWKDEDLLPTSKSMITARLKTFTSTWPYDSKKGWKPTSKKLASAGFHYFPNEEEDDCARCQYCELVLGGWEKTDDPMHEHERRRPTCPFFNCSLLDIPSVEIVTSPVAEIVKKTRSTSTATKRARAVSKRKAKEDDEVEVQQDEAEQKDQKQEPVEEQYEKGTQQVDSKATLTQKESAPQNVEENEAPRKISTSRKVSRKVQKVEDPETSPDRLSSQAETATNAGIEEEVLEEIATESTPPHAAAAAAELSQKKRISSDRDQTSSQKERESDQPTSSSSPKRFSEPEPFMIEPLKKIPKLTPAEEDMTVEAWLKTQVLSACQEMENEGKERIEKLRQQIGKGRSEIEAVLRGRSLNATVS